MSAIGPKRTSPVAPHMSAFGGKADMTVCGCLLLRSLLGVKRTSLFAPHMSAFDPKRTSDGKWANPVRPTFFVPKWSVTFLLQQFIVASAAAAGKRRIV